MQTKASISLNFFRKNPHRCVMQNRLIEGFSQKQLDEKNQWGLTPRDLAHLLGRKSILQKLAPDDLPEILFEEKGHIHSLSEEEFQKIFSVTYIPRLEFESPSVLRWVARRCKWADKKGLITKDQKWFGCYFAEELLKGKIPKVLIKLVHPTIGYGLFAHQDIRLGAFVGEYGGVVRRKKRRVDKKNSYRFEYLIADFLPTPFILDAKERGNLIRFMNHSDQPNLTPLAVHFQGVMRIVLRANRLIKKGEELTYDYGPDYWAKREKPLSFS